MAKKLFYVTCAFGCGIRAGTDENVVLEREIREQGTSNGPFRIRLATEEDISSVRAMGGRVPEL